MSSGAPKDGDDNYASLRTAPRPELDDEGPGGAPSAFLIVATAAREERVRGIVRVPAGLVVGRSPGELAPSLKIDDASLSRSHARFESLPDGTLRVTDLASTNGTFVGAARVGSGGAPAPWGVPVRVGDAVLVPRRLSAAEVVAIMEDVEAPFAPTPTLHGPLALWTHRLKRLARTPLDLLFGGETGTGKEVFAEAVHRVSGRRGPFVPVNCAAIPEALAESELFGHAKGAHSTANTARKGWLEQADGGTLFLDELGDMPGPLQAKLLRFLQDRSFAPLGSTTLRTLDVRVIGATRRGLSEDDTERGLRPDLAARLGPQPIVLPPLRARVEDVAVLAEAVLSAKGMAIHPDARHALFLAPWSGNVRELMKTLQWAAALVGDSGEPLGLHHLPEALRAHNQPAELPSQAASRTRRSETPSRHELEDLLRLHQGRVGDVARALGRQRTLVWRWVRKCGLDPDAYRS